MVSSTKTDVEPVNESRMAFKIFNPLKNASRDELIVADRKAGMTYPQISKRYGVTTQRVQQICARAAQRR